MSSYTMDHSYLHLILSDVYLLAETLLICIGQLENYGVILPPPHPGVCASHAGLVPGTGHLSFA